MQEPGIQEPGIQGPGFQGPGSLAVWLLDLLALGSCARQAVQS